MPVNQLEQMPADKVDWAPVEGAQSFSSIVRHMATGRIAFSAVLSGKPPVIPPDSITPERYATKDQLLELLRQSEAAWHEMLKALPDERLEEQLAGPAEFVMSGHDWALTMVIHESEHRGNLVVHIKTHGGTPPDFRAVLAEVMAAAPN